MRLYPNGKVLEEEIQETARANTTNYSTAKALAEGFLKELATKGQIRIVPTMNESTGAATNLIMLTDLGRNLVWIYAQQIYESEPKRYLNIIKHWVNNNDAQAKHRYRELLYHEIDVNFDLCFMLTQPRPKAEVIDHAIRLRGIDPIKNEEAIQEINDFLTRAVTVGLLLYDQREMMVINPETGEPETTQLDVYYLTDDGVTGLKLFNNQIQETRQTEDITSDPRASAGRQVLRNKFDLPLGRILGLEIIASFVYIVFALILYTSVSNALFDAIASGINTPDTLTILQANMKTVMGLIMFLGFAVLWIPVMPSLLSEIIGRILTWRKKRAKHPAFFAIPSSASN